MIQHFFVKYDTLQHLYPKVIVYKDFYFNYEAAQWFNIVDNGIKMFLEHKISILE